ncbi:MAG: hypothetical protein K6E62_09970, partial [Lachnospiraceae bacterium]|nr:hypothetical protein [Lachnospiraceae bacterium]
MKKFSKIAVKVLTVVMAAALVFANSGMKALADDIRFYVVKGGETVTDNTTANAVYGVSTDKFYEMESLRKTVTDEQVQKALKSLNLDGLYYNERSQETFEETVVSQNTEAEELTVERILEVLNINYDKRVDWYVIKKHNDGYHVDGTSIKDYYMVFSIAKAEREDRSEGIVFHGLNVNDYFQIKGVSDNENENGINRYHKSVSKAEVYEYMKNVLGTTDDTTNLNETLKNGKIEAYTITKDEIRDAETLKVEAVLDKLGFTEEVTAMTRKFVAENSAIQAFISDKYPEIDFNDYDSWYIDWYVMKTQKNGIHVDGVFVTVKDEPEQPETPETP